MRKSIVSLITVAAGILRASDSAANDYLDFAWVDGLQGMSERYGNTVAVDPDGNVYVAGLFEDSTDLDPGPGTATHTSQGSWDAFVLKLDPAGNYLWSKSFGGDQSTYAGSIYVDPFGPIYVTGAFSGTTDFDPGAGTDSHTAGTESDAFLIQLTPDGDYGWGRTFGGAGGDSCSSVVVDTDGAVYVAGQISGMVDFDPGANSLVLGSTGSNAFVSKFDSTGTHTWATVFGDPAAKISVLDVAVRVTGEIIVTGDYEGTADLDPGVGVEQFTFNGYSDFYVLCLSSSGDYQWARSFGGTDFDYADALALDNDGNVYITGAFRDTVDFDPGLATTMTTSLGLTDAYVLKLDFDGNYLWVRTFGGPDYEHGGAIAATADGALYTAGYFHDNALFEPGGSPVDAGPLHSAYVLKLTSAGVVSEVKTVGDESAAYALAANQDSVIAVGSFSNTVDFDANSGAGEISVGNADGVFIWKLERSTPADAAGLIALVTTCLLIALCARHRFKS